MSTTCSFKGVNMLIGLMGNAYNGKSTVASMLCDIGFAEYVLAEPLKTMAAAIFDLNRAQLGYSEPARYKHERDPRWGVSPRRIFQFLGTEFVRDGNTHCFDIIDYELRNKIIDYCADVDIEIGCWDSWITQLDRRLTECRCNDVVVSDIRFQNEADYIHSKGGIVVRVVRDSIVNNKNHASEYKQDQVKVDYTVHNDGSLDDLRAGVGDLLLKL